MKKLLLLIGCFAALYCSAQDNENAPVLAAQYFKEAATAARAQRLWKADLYGPTLLVDLRTRTAYANEPDSVGILKPLDGIYTGILPKEVMVSNTAINWQGKRWSVLLWPLPANLEDRTNLMLHEAFHRVQPALQLPDHSPTADHLASLNGRIYFLLELQALRAALSKPINQRKADLTTALKFRQMRKALFPDTYRNEEQLELNEGIAEFTGLVLGRQPSSIRPHLYKIIDEAAARSSLIRSAAYLTGPLYGYLLYERNPRWTARVNATTTFSGLTAAVYKFTPDTATSTLPALLFTDAYNARSIVAAETEKENTRKAVTQRYTKLFTQQPLLRINLFKIKINYNPNNLFDLGTLGTVYPTVEISDRWGTLVVTAQGMLMKNWQIATMSMESAVIEDNKITGNGWELVLNEGWKVDAGWVVKL